LLPLLSADCELLVIDNHSEPPVAETVAAIAADYPRVKTRMVYNPVNIGGGANILRCFELCDTEWMWLLGDDDLISPRAIDIILKEVKESSDALFLNYGRASFSRNSRFLTTGRTEFVNRLDSWSHLNFMSVGVYRCSRLRDNLRFGYLYSYSMSPHLAVLMASLGDDGMCVFSTERIIDEQTLASETWSPMIAARGKFTLLGLMADRQERVALAEKLRRRPSLESLAVFLHLGACDPANRETALFQYDQYCSSARQYDQRVSTAIRVRLYRLLVRYPAATRPVLKALFPLLQRLYGLTSVNQEDVRWVDLDQRM